MAYYKPAEFARLCSIKNAEVSVYKKRGKIIANENNEYSDLHYINADFIRKNRQKAGLPAHIPKADPEEQVISPQEIPIPEQATSARGRKKALSIQHSPGLNPEQQMLELKYDAETKLKEQNAEKAYWDTVLAKQKALRMAGELIPTALIGNITVDFQKSVAASYKEELEKFIIRLSKELRLTGEQVAKYRGQMYDMINDSMDRSVNISQGNLKGIIQEYMSTRSRGEHD